MLYESGEYSLRTGMIKIASNNVNSVRMGLLLLAYDALEVVEGSSSISVRWNINGIHNHH